MVAAQVDVGAIEAGRQRCLWYSRIALVYVYEYTIHIT